MSGTYSINSINLPEGSLGGASQIPSITPCNPNQLTQHKHSQTSSGIALNNVVFDRESGKPIIIQHPSFDLMMSSSYLSFRTDSQRLSPDKLILLIKCLLIIQTLPEAALEEAAEELEGISRFYANRLPQVNLPLIPASSIKGKLKATQVRPPIVLEP
ncbi:hypothetical protein C7B70_01580 [Chlorogloea sp. CCALA 695]|nr:hypothetical protein C7B70_01580 [Chlorogloea sp. CCALA 695]